MLPKLSTAIGPWAQTFNFDVITKRQENYQTVERKSTRTFKGVVAPLSARQLELKPEGQRAWRWQEVHCKTDLELRIDDEVIFKCVRYRVMAVHDFADYGFRRYELAEAFTS
jgi:hypothetical protein